MSDGKAGSSLLSFDINVLRKQCVASPHTKQCLTLLVSVAYRYTQVTERHSVFILDKFAYYICLALILCVIVYICV